MDIRMNNNILEQFSKPNFLLLQIYYKRINKMTGNVMNIYQVHGLVPLLYLSMDAPHSMID